MYNYGGSFTINGMFVPFEGNLYEKKNANRNQDLPKRENGGTIGGIFVNPEGTTMEKTTKLTVKDLAQISMMTALIAVCAWLTIPFTVPFTMQTFAVFITLLLLEGRKGTIAILLYILLGAAGVPVFHGFSGGIGVLAGPTGGYIVGFLLTGILYWMTARVRNSRKMNNLVLLAGHVLCYAFGTLWFSIVKENAGSPIGFLQGITICVLPYILPDLAKLALADLIARRVKKLM